MGMAHVAKYTKAAVGHMLNHYARREEKSDYRSNESIDPDKTDLNYNLAFDLQPMKQLDFMHKRLSEVKVQNRKDINVLCDWIVTVPKDLPEEEHRLFFEETYKFLVNRYGSANTVSAWVHMDETTPHMHFAFIPVKHGFKTDKKNPEVLKEYNKVSAKEVLTRNDLISFHGDLQAHIEHMLGHSVGILNAATIEGNRSIKELKRESAIETLQKTQIEASKIVFKAQDDVRVLEEHKKVLKEQIEGFKRDIITFEQSKTVPHTKALIGNKQVVATSDFENLCKTAGIAEALLKEIEPARKINALKNRIIADAKLKAEDIVDKAKEEAKSVSETLKSIRYKETLKRIEKVINSDPELAAAYKKAEKNLQRQESISKNKRNINLER